MALTPSTMLELGTQAPDFSLLDTVSGNTTSLADFKGKPALLVIFMCNHCPYVKHIRDGLAKFTKEYQDKGVGIVGISSNDATAYPDDSPAKMTEEAKEAGYVFPYLFDDDQSVAKAYRAACTPDFFVFDADQILVYRGQMDDSRPGNGVDVTGKDLGAALDLVLAGNAVEIEQKPSIGCNIKWKANNAPDYFSIA